MEQQVKLTVRMPMRLHELLKQRAYTMERSLNSVIIESLWTDVTGVTYPEESERERAIRMLRESGLWQPLGPKWDKYTQEAPEITHAELREKLKGVPPLSKIIIEDRGPK
jgi:hypothetical protein